MNLLELLYELSETANNILYYIFTRDYSMLKKSIFGVSLVDVAALLIAAHTTFKIIEFFLKLTGKVIASIFRAIFSHISISFLLALRVMLLRSKATTLYLWQHERVQSTLQQWTEHLTQRWQQLISRS